MGDLTMEEKCENIMNVVVESRKRFGKMCVDYEQKSLMVENRLLNLQLETISNYQFKPKQTVPAFVDDTSTDIEDFKIEVMNRYKRIEDLKKKIRNTQDVVLQLKSDNVGKKLREPLTADVLLAKAKNKQL